MVFAAVAHLPLKANWMIEHKYVSFVSTQALHCTSILLLYALCVILATNFSVWQPLTSKSININQRFSKHL